MAEDNRVEVFANSKPADARALQVGDKVRVYLLDGTPVECEVAARDVLADESRVRLVPIPPGYEVADA